MGQSLLPNVRDKSEGGAEQGGCIFISICRLSVLDIIPIYLAGFKFANKLPVPLLMLALCSLFAPAHIRRKQVGLSGSE